MAPPSISAHSSSSKGSTEIAHQQPGAERDQEGRVGEDQRQRVSNKPSWNTIVASGMNRIEGGTR